MVDSDYLFVTPRQKRSATEIGFLSLSRYPKRISDSGESLSIHVRIHYTVAFYAVLPHPIRTIKHEVIVVAVLIGQSAVRGVWLLGCATFLC